MGRSQLTFPLDLHCKAACQSSCRLRQAVNTETPPSRISSSISAFNVFAVCRVGCFRGVLRCREGLSALDLGYRFFHGFEILDLLIGYRIGTRSWLGGAKKKEMGN